MKGVLAGLINCTVDEGEVPFSFQKTGPATVCVCGCGCGCGYVYVCGCVIRVHVCMCVCVYVYVCMCVFVYVWVYITDTSPHTLRNPNLKKVIYWYFLCHAINKKDICYALVFVSLFSFLISYVYLYAYVNSISI